MSLHITGGRTYWDFNLTVQDNCIYLKINSWQYSGAGHWDDITKEDVSPDRDTIEDLKNAIIRTINKLNAAETTEPPPKIT
jgi:hypothetical protein